MKQYIPMLVGVLIFVAFIGAGVLNHVSTQRATDAFDECVERESMARPVPDGEAGLDYLDEVIAICSNR